MKIKPKAAPDTAGCCRGAPGRASRGEHGHPRAAGQEGWGAMGAPWLWGGCPPPPAAPAHLVASFVDAGRGALAQEVLGAPEVVGSALHLQQRCCWGEAHGSPRGPLASASPATEPRHLSVLVWQYTGKKGGRRTYPLAGSRQPPTSPALSRQHHAEGLRMDGGVSAAKNHPVAGTCRGWQQNTDRCKKIRANKRRAARWREAPPRPENRNLWDCKTRSASISCGWRRKCFGFLLEKKKFPELQPSQGVLGSAAAPLAQRPGPGQTLVTANGAEHRPRRSPAWDREMGSRVRSGSAARVCIQPSLAALGAHAVRGQCSAPAAPGTGRSIARRDAFVMSCCHCPALQSNWLLWTCAHKQCQGWGGLAQAVCLRKLSISESCCAGVTGPRGFPHPAAGMAPAGPQLPIPGGGS